MKKTFVIIYKGKGSAFALTEKFIKATNKTQACEILKDEVGHNIVIKKVKPL